MHQNDEPLDAAATTPGLEAVAAQVVPAGTVIDEHLFEDILELEGALRLSTTATAGIGAPRATDIEKLADELPQAITARLQELADGVRSATIAGDLTKIRECHLDVIDTLVALRAALWPLKTEE
ncbi:hypothetical protein [Novosphingobium guangzhouense]|uniref:Uncharacterized protein n=1 Tax=Novosphingobium guangzhouense TaxID=1850347 RepID=A0A2K2FUV7_9SPHN|nr:hypothetical protein [Novosphingobium guangzhouense]PNU02562.1 hypothetical protein A8V01_09305 [Novosphingobium guangzhouense]